jgi:hypothetical protein
MTSLAEQVQNIFDSRDLVGNESHPSDEDEDDASDFQDADENNDSSDLDEDSVRAVIFMVMLT